MKQSVICYEGKNWQCSNYFKMNLIKKKKINNLLQNFQYIPVYKTYFDRKKNTFNKQYKEKIYEMSGITYLTSLSISFEASSLITFNWRTSSKFEIFKYILLRVLTKHSFMKTIMCIWTEWCLCRFDGMCLHLLTLNCVEQMSIHYNCTHIGVYLP